MLCEQVAAGNLYVNRNIIGAVVGVQPFGGRGLSGTGPKAGGPLYLPRLLKKAAMPQLLKAQTVEQSEPVSQADRPVDWHDLASGLGQAFDHWHTTSMVQRTACAGLLAESLAASSDPGINSQALALLEGLIEQSHSYALPIELSGPTGESNSLLFEARGVLACVVDANDSIARSLVAASATLLSGNAVLLLCEAGALQALQTACAMISSAGFPQEAVALVPFADLAVLEEIIREAPIAGVVTAESGAFSPIVRRSLASREGGILPLIDEPFGPNYLARFFYEKTISVNTAAAGGNTDLLSQRELD